jgi:hypothetical protein
MKIVESVIKGRFGFYFWPNIDALKQVAMLKSKKGNATREECSNSKE